MQSYISSFHFWPDTPGERFRDEVGSRGLKIISKPANRHSDLGTMAEIADEARVCGEMECSPTFII